MTDDRLACRYCKRLIKPLKKSGTQIIFCKSCHSEEWINKDGSTESWLFQVGPYTLSYYYPAKQFTIRKSVDTVVEVILENDPSYMTPDSMTEERIKTIIIFS